MTSSLAEQRSSSSITRNNFSSDRSWLCRARGVTDVVLVHGLLMLLLMMLFLLLLILPALMLLSWGSQLVGQDVCIEVVSCRVRHSAANAKGGWTTAKTGLVMLMGTCTVASG